MKKFTMIILTIAAVFFATGVGLSVAGFLMGGSYENVNLRFMKQMRDLKLSSDSGIEERIKENATENARENDIQNAQVDTAGLDNVTYEDTFSSVEKLEIDLDSDKLRLAEYDGADICVRVMNDQRGNVKVTSSGSTLKIEGDGIATNRCVEVQYPADMSFQEIEISMGAGKAELYGNLKTTELFAEIGAGELVGTGRISAEKVELEVGAGAMTLDELKALEIVGECGIGKMELTISGKKEHYDYDVECGIGKVVVDGEDYQEIILDHHSHHAEGHLEGEIDLDCGMGEIQVDFIEF